MKFILPVIISKFDTNSNKEKLISSNHLPSQKLFPNCGSVNIKLIDNMKKMLLYCIVLLFCCCANDHKNDKYEALAALKVAGMFEGQVKDLPLGFRFGMNGRELDKKCDSLLNCKLFGNHVDGRGYPYFFTTENKNLNSYVYFRSGENGMYQMIYEFYDFDIITNKDVFYDSKKSVLKKVKNECNGYAYYRYEDSDIGFGETTDIFIKDNMTVVLIDNGGGKLNLYYTDRPEFAKIETPEKKQSMTLPPKTVDERPILYGENERYVKDICYAAINKEKLKEMHINLDSKDFLKQMLDDGDIIILNKYDKVIVLDFSMSGNKVRILSGHFKGRTVFIDHSLLGK